MESESRFRWNCWSRQTGKSFTKSLRRLLRGLRRGRTQVFLSAGERQSRELMTKVRQHCQALQIAFDYFDNRFFQNISVKQLEVILPGGVRIIGLPANPETARGFTGDVLLDEFAMHADDREIWAAMFPTLLRGDGELDIASTPKGCSNLFYELGSNDRFARSIVTLPDAISAGLNADADEVRRAMHDDMLYRQEFLCEFLDESTAFLTYEHISGCVDEGIRLCESPADLADVDGDLFVGVDIGRRHDLTVLWVVGGDASSCLTTQAIFEMAGETFKSQQDFLHEVLTLRKVRRCCIDAGGLGMQLAEQAVERFGAHRVEAVTFTSATKSEMATSLRLFVEARRLRIPGDKRVCEDLHSVQRTLTESGHFRLDSPRREGSHADRFWAAALAVRAAEGASGGGAAIALPVSPISFHRRGAW